MECPYQVQRGRGLDESVLVQEEMALKWITFHFFSGRPKILDLEGDGPNRALGALLGNGGLFQFDVGRVCSELLCITPESNFSRTIQCSVTETPGSVKLWSGFKELFEGLGCLRSETYPSSLERTPDATNDILSDRRERSLPFFSKNKVHVVPTIEFRKL